MEENRCLATLALGASRTLFCSPSPLGVSRGLCYPKQEAELFRTSQLSCQTTHALVIISLFFYACLPVLVPERVRARLPLLGVLSDTTEREK